MHSSRITNATGGAALGSAETKRSRLGEPSTPARGTVYLGIAQGAFLFGGFIGSVLLARGLGPATFGVYGVVISVLSWFERVLNVGIAHATATLIPHHAATREVIETTARKMLLLWSLPLFALLWAPAEPLADYFSIPSGARLFRIAALHLPTMALYYAYEGILNGRRFFGAVSFMQVARAAIKLGGILVLLAFGLSLLGALVAHVVGTAAAVVLIATAIPLAKVRASLSALRTLLRAALPMAAYAITLVVLLNLSLWQLRGNPTVAEASVGLYVTSLNLMKILMVVPATVTVVLFTWLSWALARSRHDLAAKYVQEAARFALIVTVPACVLLWMDGEPLVQLLFGPEYAGGGRILSVLSLAFAAVGFSDIHLHALMADGRPGLAAAVLGSLAPLLFALNRLLIPERGALGAATACMIVTALAALAGAALAYRRFGPLVRSRTVLRVAAAGLAIGTVSALIPTSGVWVVVELAGLLVGYLAILFVTGEVSRLDLKPFAVWRADPV